MGKEKFVAGGGCFCALLIAGAIMIGCSFGVLGPTDMGLDYDSINIRINEVDLFENGRYFIGLGHEFIIFPKRLKTIRMSDQASSGGGEGEEGEERVTSQLLARTMDGLPVTLDLSFQYRLMPSAESLVKLYKDFQTDYESAYIRIARNVLRDVAADYQAFNYFYNRSVISSAMRGSLDVALMQHSATVQSFQLLNILLPPRFSSAIEETEIARQEIENAGYQQAVSITEANTRVREAERQAKIILLAANATAANITLQAGAEADVLLRQVEAEREAYKAIKEALGFNEEELLSYVWLKAMGNRNENAQNVIGVEKPAPLEIGYTSPPSPPSEPGSGD
jgi:prohibitin 2